MDLREKAENIRSETNSSIRAKNLAAVVILCKKRFALDRKEFEKFYQNLEKVSHR